MMKMILVMRRRRGDHLGQGGDHLDHHHNEDDIGDDEDQDKDMVGQSSTL